MTGRVWTRVGRAWPAAVALLVVVRPCAAAGGMPYPGDLGQAVATLAIFLLLLFVLGKWAWKPVLKQLERREEMILGRIKHAEDREAKAEALAEEYRQHMANIDTEAEHVLAEARRTAAARGDEVLAQARSDADRTRKRADEEITASQAEARKALQGETAAMAAEIARQVLRRRLDADAQQQLVRDAREMIAQRVDAAGDEG